MANLNTIPRLSYTEGEKDQQVIQLYVDGEPFLRFGKGFHADILTIFLEECDGLGEPLVPQETFDGYKREPPLKGGRYEVIGMGQALIFPGNKTIYLGGHSHNYHIDVSRKHSRDMQSHLPDWTLIFKEI